jgi:hypothetical protein
MGSLTTNATTAAAEKSGAGAMSDARSAQEDPLYLFFWYEKTIAILSWLRDVVIKYAQVVGMVLFVFAGVYSGYALVWAMLGILGIAGTIVILLLGGGGVALFAYLDYVDELEEAEIEKEVEEEYQTLKEEEQRLLREVTQEAERRDQQMMDAEFGEELDLPPMPSEEDLEAMFLEADEAAENAVDKLASIQKLRGLRDRLMKLSMHSSEESSSRQAKVLEKLSSGPAENLREIFEELDKALDTEPVSEDSSTREEGDRGAQETTLQEGAEEARHETLRRRAAGNVASSSVSKEEAD